MKPAVARSDRNRRVVEFPHVKFKLLSLAKPTSRQKAVVDALGKEKLIEMYRKMLEIRFFEQRAEQMYQQRKIGGFLHVYMGEEAVATGILAAIDKDDYVVTSYRDHGVALALGIPPGALMAELFGKVTGVCGGKGGSMHFYSKEKNLLGGHGIVGGQIPIGLGAAFRAKYMGTKQVSVIFFGDGAINQGVFHEAANMAALWNLPAIFVVENNLYGMGTSVSRSTAVSNMAVRAASYDMEGLQVDGMNLLETYGVMKEVVDKRRRDPCPILIEAKTYRYRGHSISDPGNYRSKEEIANYRTADPIAQVKKFLGDLGWMDDAAAKAMDKEVRQEILDAVEFAEESPDPDPAARDRHVFVP